MEIFVSVLCTYYENAAKLIRQFQLYRSSEVIRNTVRVSDYLFKFIKNAVNWTVLSNNCSL